MYRIYVSLAVCSIASLTACGRYDDAAYPHDMDEDGYTDPTYAEPETPALPPESAEETDPSALATFRPVLDPYGVWVDDPTYGTLWLPSEKVVGADFSPYLTAGHWSMTDDGYYWASDYDWGWAPFHYGRWTWLDGRGWAWIPGARYAPAWVDYRYGDGLIGWGPTAPSWGWYGGGGMYVSVWAANPCVFAPVGSFFSPTPHTAVFGPGSTPAPGVIAGMTAVAPPAPRTPGFVPGPGIAARPFHGPDPRAVGFPEGAVERARIAAPARSLPAGVGWRPAPSSRIAPIPRSVTPPAGYDPRRGPPPGSPGVYGPRAPIGGPRSPVYPPSGARPPVYGPSTGPRPPVYSPSPPIYSPGPRPPIYSPSPRGPAPPTYSPAPPTYSPRPPTYSPRPPTYSPTPSRPSPPPISRPSPPSAPISRPSAPISRPSPPPATISRPRKR